MDVNEKLNSQDAFLTTLLELSKDYVDDGDGVIFHAFRAEQCNRAVAFFQRNLADAQATQDLPRMIQALIGLGHCKRLKGQSTESTGHFDQAVALSRRAGAGTGSSILLQVAFEYLKQNRADDAVTLVAEGLGIATRAADRDAMRWVTTLSAMILSAGKQHDKAIAHFRSALRLARHLGHGGTIIFSLYMLANELVRGGRIEEATRWSTKPCN